MKNLFCFFYLLILVLNTYCQNSKSNEINNWIENNPGELIPIRIEFNENIDCYELCQKFKINQTPVDQRPKIINRLLHKQALKSQENVLNFLKKNTK